MSVVAAILRKLIKRQICATCTVMNAAVHLIAQLKILNHVILVLHDNLHRSLIQHCIYSKLAVMVTVR